jgi:formamidopyrimidine-DNA glycosylase
MPELPEVEVARRNLAKWLKGQRVVRAEAERTRIFRGADPSRFEALRGRLRSAERKGKYLLLTFEKGQGLLAHLGMTGKFVRRKGEGEEPHSRARLFLASGQVIHYRDPRMFGRLLPVEAGALAQLPEVKALGRDLWLDPPSAAELQSLLGSSKKPIKLGLMDQEKVAGLGNIHAAEALFRARIFPGRSAKGLSPKEWDRLATAIHETLAFGLKETQADEVQYVEEGQIENPFLVYGRGDEPCRRCGTLIRSFAQGGRTTYYCPACQPRRVKEP